MTRLPIPATIASPVIRIVMAGSPLTGSQYQTEDQRTQIFARPSKTSHDAKPTLNYGNRTQRSTVRRKRAAWHAEGHGFESP
jgi:hypothetical protein